MNPKTVGLGSAAFLVMVMQFFLFGIALDFMSDFMLVGLAYAAGRWK